VKLYSLALVTLVSLGCFGQDSQHEWNTSSPIFTMDSIDPPNFVMQDDCKPSQTIKTVSGKLLALCVDGRWESDWGVASKWETFDQVTVACIGCKKAEKISPEDVLAIQEKRKIVSNTGCPPDENGSHGPSGNMCYVFTDGQAYTGKWTCADTRRILQVSESGTHWCHMPKTQKGNQ